MKKYITVTLILMMSTTGCIFKKYEMLKNNKINHQGITLHRIKRLSDGLMGGYIEAEKNLSHCGDSFVYDNAKVYGNAMVYDDAWVGGNAQVYGNAIVSWNAWVGGDARVYGNVRVGNNVKVYGDVFLGEFR